MSYPIQQTQSFHSIGQNNDQHAQNPNHRIVVINNNNTNINIHHPSQIASTIVTGMPTGFQTGQASRKQSGTNSFSELDNPELFQHIQKMS